MRRVPPLPALGAFVQVARIGSGKAAAGELALATPALSRRVQALERFVGKTLFDRKHQAMELNADGQRLLDNIAPALDVLTMAVEEVQKDSNQLRLRLSVLPLFASQRLFPRMGELRRQHPNLHLDVETTPHSISRLGEGLDAAIVLAQDVDPSLYAHQLDHDEVYLIAARDLVHGPNAITRPEQLANMTILIHREMPMGSEEHTYELQSLMRHTYAVFCLKKKKQKKKKKYKWYIIIEKTKELLMYVIVINTE